MGMQVQMWWNYTTSAHRTEEWQYKKLWMSESRKEHKACKPTQNARYVKNKVIHSLETNEKEVL